MSIPGTIKSKRLTRFGTVGICYIRGQCHVYHVSSRGLQRKEDRKKTTCKKHQEIVSRFVEKTGKNKREPKDDSKEIRIGGISLFAVTLIFRQKRSD